MESRTFNSLMPKYNEKWVSKVLNMKYNNNNGPDIIDDKKAVEVKFNLVYPVKKVNKFWKIDANQLEYEKDWNEIYWGLGFYWMNKRVSEVNGKDVSNLEKLVDYRELYLINWDWVKQFPKNLTNGKTYLSEWNFYLISPRASKLPEIENEKSVSKGKIFFTKGVNPELFETKNCSEDEEDEVPF